MTTPKPKIDDQFWFDYSYDLVKDSLSRLDKAIDSINKFTTGLLTVYTVSAIFTIEYKDIEEPYLMFLFALPYMIVLFEQWYATTSKVPIAKAFDARIPAEIRKAHLEIHQFKERRLNYAIVISFITTLFVAITLMLGFLLGNKKIKEEKAIKAANEQKVEDDKKKKEPYLEAKFEKKKKLLLVTGYFPANRNIKIFLTHYLEKDTIRSNPMTFLNSRSGLFFKSIQLNTIGVKSRIHIEWDEQNQHRAIIKDIEPK